MVFYDPEQMALYAAMMGGMPELPEGPSEPTGIVPRDHCPIHPEIILLHRCAKLTVSPGGVWSTKDDGDEPDWCSQCDLEIEWARQRPHLELV